jgi:hypothetical protein
MAKTLMHGLQMSQGCKSQCSHTLKTANKSQSKVVTIPVADSGIIRPIIVLSEALPHTNALTSEHRRRGT